MGHMYVNTCGSSKTRVAMVVKGSQVYSRQTRQDYLRYNIEESDGEMFAMSQFTIIYAIN